MPYPYANPDAPAADAPWSDLDPQAAGLIDTLSDCCHPRAGRLKARLADNPDADQLALLRGEVLNVLALSFGTAEAQRRLRAVQPQRLQ